MNRPVLVLALVAVAAPAAAAVPQPGEFRANIKPEVTEVNPEDYQFLAKYFLAKGWKVSPGGFQLCWSQPVVGWADLVSIRGEWIYCSNEDLMIADPFTPLEFGPELYGIPGIIKTDFGEIYTWTTRASGWNSEALKGIGGLTRLFGGTGVFNYALGWTTDRPKEYPPSSWTISEGAVEVLEEGTQDHPRFPAGWGNPEGMTRLEFPARVPGNIAVPGQSDWFIFEAKKGWRYGFGTTLGTLDDSLVAIWGHIEGPDECDCPSREKCMGTWWEDDGDWDGDGSYLGPVTAPADCTYFMEVLDWGRDGTSYTGTYTLWLDEYPPLPSADTDGDGVEDDKDMCPGTEIPEAVPTVRLGLNRFALTDNSGVFQTVREPGTGPGPVFTISDTGGCSCEQIVEATGGALRQLRVGCTLGTISDWIDQVNP